MEAPKIPLTPRNVWLATVIRIVDGDTLIATLDLGFGLSLQKPCRIRGYDAPELQSNQRIEALRAQDALHALLPPGHNFLVVCPSWDTDRYCRVIGDWHFIDGTDIRTLLPQEYLTPKRP